ncbi:MAG TPA: proteasome assembly chaperone family protein [Candidatus Thermoplasmatota archaeon]|nr:proteasome assembly chaperone family protein [Candidatus Thermoplasmatota archaeon]
MQDVQVIFFEEPELRNPIFIEGLPGVGNVGKLAADHLIEELGAVKLAEIYSKYFPPQVLVQPDGTIRLVNNELYYWKAQNADQNDLIILIGDYQGLTADGQYVLVNKFLDIVEKYGVKELYTLGGYGTGKISEKPRVLGAATDKELVKDMKKRGVQFKKNEPGGGIVGASGLLLGMGKLRGMRGVCLMGETSGYLVDPKSAQSVLEILSDILGVKVDFSDLESRAEQMDKLAQQLRDLERTSENPTDEDLRYIG